MIPIALLVGLLAGRWRIVLVVALAWPVALVLLGDCGWSCVPGAAGLAAANTAVGVIAHKALVTVVGDVRRVYSK